MTRNFRIGTAFLAAIVVLGVASVILDHRATVNAAGVMAPTTDMLYDFIGKAVCGMELF